MEFMPQAIRDGIIVVLVISGPLVLAAAFLGLIIGVLQAATQVQEQTIGSAVKIIGIFAIIIFAGFWMFQYLNQYTTRSISTAFTIVPNQSQKVIPKEAYRENKIKSEKTNPIQAIQPLKVNPPQEIENKNAIGGTGIGAPLLGTPEIPKHPPVTQIQPAMAPQIPNPPTRPNLPAFNLQELKPIPPPIKGNVVPQENKINNKTQDGEGEGKNPLINLVPGEPVDELWQRKEAFSENLENKTANEESTDENLPSWLN